MKSVKIISIKRKTLRTMDTVTTVRAKVSGYPSSIIEDYPRGRINKKCVTFKFDNAPEDMDFASWITESLEFGMQEMQS